MNYEYDQKHDGVSYNYYRCEVCKSEFYGGGPALHKKGCADTGYDNCTFVFGPKHVEQVKKIGAERPDQPWWGLTLNMLRERFPHLLQ